MRIAIVEELQADIRIPKGPHEGELRYYKTALLNTLIHLRPRLCLEIGTWRGGSAKVFRYYFNKYCPTGHLVTADIKRYENITSKHVTQVRVYPHTLDIFALHKKVAEDDLLPNWRRNVERSVEANANMVLSPISKKKFDFAFVDGDHWNLLKDVEIVKRVVKPPGYALLDDTTAFVWPCSWVYQDEIKPHFNTYDFEDWRMFPGTSLIWK